MLNLTAVSSAGSLTYAGVTTIPEGDGQVNAGVPNNKNSTLICWGLGTTIADTIKQLCLVSQDMADSLNGEFVLNDATSVIGLFMKWTKLPFKNGPRVINAAQNTAAANEFGFYMDSTEGGALWGSGSPKDKVSPNCVTTLQAFGGALTALKWGTQGFSPTTALKAGKYAILGCWVTDITNYGLIRFNHVDFKGAKPGFPIVNTTDTAVSNAVQPRDPLIMEQGYQFVHIGELAGSGQCPVFEVGPAGTGLNIEMLSITADTPSIVLNLIKVA